MNLHQVKNYITDTLNWLNDKPSPVGCMLLSPNGKLLFFHNIGKEHCEQIVYANFSSLKNHIIFLTLEPCFSCTFLLCRKEIDAIFFGAYNLDQGALGGCINLTSFRINYKLKYWGGILKENCECFIKDFFKQKRNKN